MELDKLLKLKPYSKLIAGFGVVSLGFGLAVDKIPDIVKRWHLNNIYPNLEETVLLTAIALPIGLFKILDERIDKNIQDEIKEGLRKQKEIAEGVFKSKFNEHKKFLEELEDKVREQNLSEDIQLEISTYIDEAQMKLSKMESYFHAAEEIFIWLNTSDAGIQNRNSLLKHALESVEVDNSFRNTFRKDLWQCIHWIYCHISTGQECPIEPSEKYISAYLEGMPGNATPYITALKAIRVRLRRELMIVSDKDALAWVLDDIFEYLIEHLEDTIAETAEKQLENTQTSITQIRHHLAEGELVG